MSNEHIMLMHSIISQGFSPSKVLSAGFHWESSSSCSSLLCRMGAPSIIICCSFPCKVVSGGGGSAFYYSSLLPSNSRLWAAGGLPRASKHLQSLRGKSNISSHISMCRLVWDNIPNYQPNYLIWEISIPSMPIILKVGGKFKIIICTISSVVSENPIISSLFFQRIHHQTSTSLSL